MKRIIAVLCLILIFNSVFAADYIIQGNQQTNPDNTQQQVSIETAQTRADIANLSKKMDDLEKSTLSKADVNAYRDEVFLLLDQKVSEFFTNLIIIILTAGTFFFLFLGFAKGRKWL